MNPTASNDWLAANQRHLMAALGQVRAALERHAGSGTGCLSVSPSPKSEIRNPKEIRGSKSESLGSERIEDSLSAVETDSRPSDFGFRISDFRPTGGPLAGAAHSPDSPSSLQALCAAFGLSSFERDVLLLCAGRELDGSFAACCTAAHGDTRCEHPTFSLALAALPGAHWTALTPDSPLRRWRLIELRPGDTLTTAPLRIDERVLHFLTGLNGLDERLQGLVQPVATEDHHLAPSQLAVARRIAALWSSGEAQSAPPAVQICGADAEDARAVAAAACAACGRQLHALRAADLPSPAPEREALARLWEREAVFTHSALLVEATEAGDAERTREISAFLESVAGLVLVARRDPLPAWRRSIIRLDVPKPAPAEQKSLWQETLGSAAAALNGELDRAVAQFDLGARTIRAAATEISQTGASVWDICRAQLRPRLDGLAQRLPPAATWDDLVLPSEPRQVLREIAAQVRQRFKVYDTWGFSAKCARGLGISALFAGPSGTGKTMAAEVLAHDLRLDLYRIDLSAVVSKYIGETEKNLRRIFDTAEDSGVILLFDEADALFGKRSDVKDSHDRYANIEVSYLLQRMEAYRGLAILTTNFKTALDNAFLRRIRFVVPFPFPDAAQRGEIWRRIFPSKTPTAALATDKLALLNIPGGNIRNIALNAAFLAADESSPVRMAHVLRAARTEYAKLEKPLSDAEIKGWP